MSWNQIMCGLVYFSLMCTEETECDSPGAKSTICICFISSALLSDCAAIMHSWLFKVLLMEKRVCLVMNACTPDAARSQRCWQQQESVGRRNDSFPRPCFGSSALKGAAEIRTSESETVQNTLFVCISMGDEPNTNKLQHNTSTPNSWLLYSSAPLRSAAARPYMLFNILAIFVSICIVSHSSGDSLLEIQFL